MNDDGIISTCLRQQYPKSEYLYTQLPFSWSSTLAVVMKDCNTTGGMLLRLEFLVVGRLGRT
jgi:hypothetical protein